MNKILAKIINVRALFLAVFALTLLPTIQAEAAASLVIRPTRVVIVEGQDVVAISVENQGAADAVIQLQLMSWEQVDGEDVYTPADDDGFLMACPPMFTVPAGERQVVRVGLQAGDNDWNIENAYRLFIQEIPPEPTEGDTAVQVAVRIGVPVFLEPADYSQPSLSWNFEALDGGGLQATVSNAGTVHALISGVQFTGPAGLVFEGSAHQYVLPGSTMSWRVDATNPISSAIPDTLQMVVASDQGPYEESVSVNK